MTSRERWLAVLTRGKPDRVPMDYWATWEANQKLTRHMGAANMEEVFRRLHIDSPLHLGGTYVGPEPTGGADVFGCRFRSVDHGTGSYSECVHHPLAEFGSVEEIERNYTWPSPDWWEYSGLPGEVAGNEHRPVWAGGSEPFNAYCKLRGQERAYMDLSLEPGIVHYCLDKLFDLAYEGTRRMYEAIPGRVTFSFVSEDLGSQEGLLYSPAHIREFLLPRMKRMMHLAREGGAYVFTHSDGGVRKIIPDLIEIGTEILNPVQWRCRGMGREGLKRDFGDRLVFHGGMDNQQTLPFGSVADVRREVIDNLRILGEGGGYILCPCHAIQSVGPPENVVAMYETGYEEGWT